MKNRLNAVRRILTDHTAIRTISGALVALATGVALDASTINLLVSTGITALFGFIAPQAK